MESPLLIPLLTSLGLVSLLSASEAALGSMGPKRVRQLVETGDESSLPLTDWLDFPGKYLVAIFVGRLLGVTGTTVCVTSMFLQGTPPTPGKLILAFGTSSILLLVLGILIPKQIGRLFPLSVSRLTLRPVSLLGAWIEAPRRWAATRPLFQLLFGPLYSAHEIQAAIPLPTEKILVDEGEKEMLAGLVGFDARQVREVMVPRVSICALRSTSTREEALATFSETGHSRLPVYEEDSDHVAGILHVLDVLANREGLADEWNITSCLQKAIFVPETKYLGELLRQMQRQRLQMVLAVNEYGVLDGLVTLEDLLEEIVGEIHDEHDPAETPVLQLDTDRYEVEAQLDLIEASKIFDMALPRQNVTSLGGWLIEQVGHIPRVDEIFTYRNLEFRIKQGDDRQLQRIVVTVRSENSSQKTGMSHGS